MTSHETTPERGRAFAPRLAVAALLVGGLALLTPACGEGGDETPTVERVDPEKLAEEMKKRAAEEIDAENLDAELEKLEKELGADSE